MSLHFDPSCRMSLSPMLHVEFKKCSCRPVEFNGQGPLYKDPGAKSMGSSFAFTDESQGAPLCSMNE